VTSPPTRSAFLVQIHIYLRHTGMLSPDCCPVRLAVILKNFSTARETF
jgi:hypothetical protein